ncbi:MAG: hypothetical protein SGI86_05875 [Deltaproteobacteria bacterium]|nr:hypothetical protein [Deltaproteobacteria bacterium]
MTAPVQLLQGPGQPLTQICDIVPTAFGVVTLRSETANGTCIENEKRSVWFTGGSLTGYDSSLPTGLYAKQYEPLRSGGQQSLIGNNWVVALFGNNFYINAISLYAKLNDGRVFAWGNNQSGQLGFGDHAGRSVPTDAPAWKDVRAIVSSFEVTLGLLPNGSVLAAGSALGQTLGLASVTTGFQTTPALVEGLVGVRALGVSTSTSSAFAIVETGLRYWGSGATNMYGESSRTPRIYPVPDTSLESISVGNQHVLGIDKRGGVYAWGSNQILALGCGVCDDNKVPTLVTVP